MGDVNYRMFFKDSSGALISPWHDIPLPSMDKKNSWFPFLCEIPKGRTEKMEVCLSEKFNPIAQDTKDKKPRYLSIVPKFNYGMFPRTFETPKKACPISGLLGDGDPIDVVDIATKALTLGSLVPVKILGSFCFVDGGEADWKVVVSSNENDELNKHVLEVMFGFFEQYKGPESGNFIFDDRKVFGVGETIELIKLANMNYNELKQSYRMTRTGGESDEDEPHDIWVPGSERV